MPFVAPRPDLSSYDPHWYVARPDEERRAIESLHRGGLAIVDGPLQSGKSWFVRRLVEALSAQQGEKAVRLAVVSWAPLRKDAELDALYDLFAVQVAHALSGPAAWIESMRSSPLTGARRLTRWMTQYVLPSVGLVVIAFEQIDHLVATRLGDEIFGLLRSWYVPRPKWSSLRFIVETESMRGLEIEMGGGAFDYYANIEPSVRLRPFGLAQAEELAKRHGLSWKKESIERLVDYVGGHPHLLHLAVLAGVEQRIDPETIAARGVSLGIFADHLAGIRRALGEPEIRRAAEEVMASRRRLPLQGPYLRLDRLGLVSWARSDEPPRLSAPIYRDVVKEAR